MIKKRTLVLRAINDTTNGRIILICNPVKEVNETGAFSFTPQQFINFANQVPCSPELFMMNVKGSVLSFETEFAKAGETWERKDKSGKIVASGINGAKNGGKDSWRNSNFVCELSDKAIDRLTNARSYGETSMFEVITPKAVATEEIEDELLIAEEVNPAPVPVEDEQQLTP